MTREHAILEIVMEKLLPLVYAVLADYLLYGRRLRPRRNAFARPAVANIDQLVIIASGAFV